MCPLKYKDQALIVHQQEPFNAGPPLPLLRQNFITPQSRFYVRSHGTIPDIQADQFILKVDGNVKKSLNLSLDALQTGFTTHTIMATMECAGNRRREMLPDADPKTQVMWGSEAISNASWTGVRLRDVLMATGVDSHDSHVAFLGLDEVTKDHETFGFGGSIPIEKALKPEVLLVYEMNGEPLLPVHGFPLRVVVPGYIAARSVKWLAEITVQDTPSNNYFQMRDYKMFPPDVTEAKVDWKYGDMLEHLNLNSVICTPSQDEQLAAGDVLISGYALSCGENSINRVEVSVDNGETWTEAHINPSGEPWAWRFWETTVNLAPGIYTLVVRASDSNGSTQPDTIDSIWNFRGYMNNAWHRINITVQ